MRDAYTTALKLLSARELSEAQLRMRLVRRECDPDDIERTLERLRRDGAVDDRRVARTTARVEASMRHRGRSRALQRIRHLGIDADIAQRAVDDVFADIDETGLLDRAIDRRLKGAAVSSLDRRATARIVRALLAQGFQAGAIFARLRSKDVASPNEE